MTSETKQETIVCRHCGQSISSVAELRRHSVAHSEPVVNTVLSAQTKHGASLGEHHAELDGKRRSRLKDSLDRHYHEIMLAEMTIELILILVLVILAWRAA